MSTAMFSEAINIQSFLQYLLGYCCKTTYHQDNETLLTILASGYSAKLRHCGRVHRINIASMSEQIDDDLVVATYCPTKKQIANGLTKVINPCEWLVQLGLKLVPKEDKALIILADTVARAEAFAGSLPQRINKQHLVQLLSYLPREQSARAEAADDVHSFASGAFVHGGIVGARSLTRMFPKSTAVITRFFGQLMPSHSFTAVIVQEGVMAPLHGDSHNAPDSKNLLVNLTPCTEPLLWVEDPEGDSPCPAPGVRLQGFLVKSPARFDPRRWHASIATSNPSTRFTAVAFTIRDANNTSPDDCRLLRELGFKLQ